MAKSEPQREDAQQQAFGAVDVDWLAGAIRRAVQAPASHWRGWRGVAQRVIDELHAAERGPAPAHANPDELAGMRDLVERFRKRADELAAGARADGLRDAADIIEAWGRDMAAADKAASRG